MTTIEEQARELCGCNRCGSMMLPYPPACLARQRIAAALQTAEDRRQAVKIDRDIHLRERDEALAKLREMEAAEQEDDARGADIRTSTNEMMKEALGAEMYSRLWGPELERLGHVGDRIQTQRDEATALLRESHRWLQKAHDELANVQAHGGWHATERCDVIARVAAWLEASR